MRVRPCDVEGLLGQVVYIDLVDQDEVTARATLLQGVKHKRRKPGTPPIFPFMHYASRSAEHPSFPGALPAVWNIPYPRNPYFTGREELLRRLAASLRAGETVGISQPQAVSGLGGVGKTQAVKLWLTSHTRWLLLLDNADDLTLVRDFLPPAGRGHTLLTTRAASMGRLAHAIEVDALDREPGALLLLRLTYRLWAERVVQAVYQALPQEVDFGPNARYDRCLPHAQECAQLIEQEHLTSSEARWLLHQTGRYLWQHARYAEAEIFYQRSLRIIEQVLGPDHSDVAPPLIGPATLYYEQGKYAEAEPLYQRALRIREQALGPDHPSTQEVVRNYAMLLRKLEREAEASELEARFSSS